MNVKHRVLILKYGIPTVLLKYTVQGYNPSTHLFTVAIVGCSWCFGYPKVLTIRLYTRSVKRKLLYV
jgi:hypothetical protein